MSLCASYHPDGGPLTRLLALPEDRLHDDQVDLVLADGSGIVVYRRRRIGKGSGVRFETIHRSWVRADDQEQIWRLEFVGWAH